MFGKTIGQLKEQMRQSRDQHARYITETTRELRCAEAKKLKHDQKLQALLDARNVLVPGHVFLQMRAKVCFDGRNDDQGNEVNSMTLFSTLKEAVDDVTDTLGAPATWTMPSDDEYDMFGPNVVLTFGRSRSNKIGIIKMKAPTT